MRSPFCLSELGAAWALEKHIIPILFEPVTTADYNKTPLQGRQFTKPEKLGTVFDELRDMGYISFTSTEEFNKHYKIFFESLRYAERSENKFIATIIQDRADMHCNSNLQGKRCLKLNALIPLSTPPADGETHWLFFDDDKNTFGDPKVGDVIKFVVSGNKYHESPWNDGLEKTRNIYTNKRIIILNK